MRLAIITHNVVRGDGQGRANYEIVRHAARNGVQVTLIADRVDSDVLTWSNVAWIKIQPKIRSNWLVHGLDFQRQADRLVRRTREDYDVIHGYGATLTLPHHVNTSQFVHSAWLRSPMHTARQHRNAYGAYQWLYSTLNAAIEKRAYRQAKVVVAASHTVRGELMSIGVPESRLRVILNGADPAEFHPGAANRASLGLPVNVPLALFAGDIRTNRKNLDTVLKALARTPGTHLAVVGKLEGSAFPALAETLGISDRVAFLDFRRDIAEIMRAVDYFVFPSRYEACALVLVEAIASGLPVITAKTTGGSEVIRPGSGTLLDDPNDEAALAHAISAMSGDAARRAAMGTVALAESKKHTWDIVAESYLQLYRECAAKSVRNS